MAGIKKVEKLSSDGLVITRRRKKWKFAHFDQWENCFVFSRGDDPKLIKTQLDSYFQGWTLGIRPLVLEIAAGNAQFSLELAKKHPDINYLAVDIKSDRLYTSAKHALNDGVHNIAFLRMHLGELDVVIKSKSVSEIWLTFPDPHPKKRSAKHRLSGEAFLRQYRKILSDTGILKFKTDNRALFLWSLEQFVANQWHIKELSFDLHESNLPDEYKIMTYYEKRFIAEGIPTNFCSIVKS